MKQIIRKELREYRWLILGAAAVLSLGYFRSLSGLNQEQLFQNIQRDSTTLVSAFVSASFMFALGFGQSYLERRRGRWAFLVHRPISIAQIYAGKVAAAFIAFSFAIVLPSAVAVAYFAMPGIVPAPFSFSAVVPMGLDLFAAWPYYFCALAMGAWEVPRWLRPALLGLPLLSTLVSYYPRWPFPSPFQSLIFTAAAAAIMAAGAYQLFTGGRRASRSLVPLALAGVLGFCIHAFTLNFLPRDTTWVDSNRRAPGESETHTGHFVSRDGRFLEATTRDGRIESMRDENGDVVAMPGLAGAVHDLSADTVTIHRSHSSSRGFHFRKDHRFDRIQRRSDFPEREWYFDTQEQAFSAYDRVAGARAGWLGPDGFSADEPVPFADAPLSEITYEAKLLVFPEGVFRADWDESSIESLLRPREELTAYNEMHMGFDSRVGLASSESFVHVFAEGEHLASLPRSGSATDTEFGFAPGADVLFLVEDEATERRWKLFDLDGQLLATHSETRRSGERRHTSARVAGLAPVFFAPPLATAFDFVGQVRSQPNRLEFEVAHVVSLTILALFWALVGFVFGRRKGHERFGIAALAFVFGPSPIVLARFIRPEHVPREASSSEPASHSKLIDPKWMPPPSRSKSAARNRHRGPE